MKTIKINEENGRETQIVSINYDMYNLSISIDLDNNNKMAMIIFEAPIAFFVADEGDFNYWKEKSIKDGIIFEIDEKTFIKERMANNHFNSGSEHAKNYIVIGKNECIEVITKIDPKIVILAGTSEEH